jgi:hypothetical protein
MKLLDGEFNRKKTEGIIQLLFGWKVRGLRIENLVGIQLLLDAIKRVDVANLFKIKGLVILNTAKALRF